MNAQAPVDSDAGDYDGQNAKRTIYKIH